MHVPYPLFRAPYHQGFTLLEMAIVLTIISLLAGGVLVGQDMIRVARLNSIISDVEKYKTATDTFKTKYEQLPGDMVDAHDHWDDGADGVCGTAAQCNGDGDLTFDRVSANENERLRAWQHLLLADLIPGNYIGFESTANDEEIDVNLPGSQIDGAGFRFDTVSGTATNVIEFGADIGDPGLMQSGALPADEAASIDSKADDGVANAGFITSINATAMTGCIINPGTDDNYDLDNINVACLMRFRLE